MHVGVGCGVKRFKFLYPFDSHGSFSKRQIGELQSVVAANGVNFILHGESPARIETRFLEVAGLTWILIVDDVQL